MGRGHRVVPTGGARPGEAVIKAASRFGSRKQLPFPRRKRAYNDRVPGSRVKSLRLEVKEFGRGSNVFEYGSPAMSARESYLVPSTTRAMSVLEFLARSRRGASISEISRNLVLPKSSTYLILKTLEEEGYLRRNAQSGKLTWPAFLVPSEMRENCLEEDRSCPRSGISRSRL